jgi:ABC-type nitrate/sulfonate/bicarbonate transport system permease component
MASLSGTKRVKVARWAASFLIFFVIWEIVGRTGFFLSIVPASETIPELFRLLGEGEILGAARGTLTLAATGFLIGAVLGVSIGTWVATSKRAAAVLDPLISASFSIPFSIFIPIISIYLGLEFKAKVFLVILFNIFVIIINTSAGIRDVPHGPQEMARAFGVSRTRMFRKVILPWASPHIITGLRLGVGRSVQGAILADLFLRAQDLGLFIVDAQGHFDIPRLLATVFFVTMLAAGVMAIARFLEWRLLAWKRL